MPVNATSFFSSTATSFPTSVLKKETNNYQKKNKKKKQSERVRKDTNTTNCDGVADKSENRCAVDGYHTNHCRLIFLVSLVLVRQRKNQIRLSIKHKSVEVEWTVHGRLPTTGRDTNCIINPVCQPLYTTKFTFYVAAVPLGSGNPRSKRAGGRGFKPPPCANS